MASTDYPIPAYNYEVTINNTPFAFAEISGLKLEYETVVYKHGMSYTMGPELLYGQRVINTVTLKRAVIPKRANLLSWLQNREKRNVFIKLYNEHGRVLIQWDLPDAIAVKTEMRGFDASSNELTIESIELMVHNMRINYF
jgi:phage tail-like protein